MKTNNSKVYETNVLYTQEEERKLVAIIVDNFHNLINRSEDEGLYWKGLTCDLVELSYIVWQTGKLTTPQGKLMDFKTIVYHICRVLHVKMPANPSSVMTAVRARKNIKVGPIKERYLQVQKEVGIKDPMKLEIRYRRRRGGQTPQQ